MDKLPLLDRVLKESMRVLPASAYSQRINVEPVELGPFQLPKGTPIIFSPLITHHMPDLFPEPERFLPDRWLELTTSPYAYMPFAAGPRMCLGASLAMTTLKVTLPLIVQRFRLTVVPGATINGAVRSTMLAPTNGMFMMVSDPTAPFAATPIQGNIHEMVELPEVSVSIAANAKAAKTNVKTTTGRKCFMCNEGRVPTLLDTIVVSNGAEMPIARRPLHAHWPL